MENSNDSKTNEPTVGNPSGGIFSGCAIQIFGGILFLALMGSSPGGAIFCAFAGVIIGGLIIMQVQKTHSNECDASDKYRREKFENEFQQAQSVFLPKYNTLCESLGKPVDTKEVCCDRESGDISYFVNNLDCWVKNEILYLLTSTDGFDHVLRSISSNFAVDTNIADLTYQKIIPVRNIKFFQREGEIYTETKISGGGGGGSSLKGAVVGGILAGDAGAVIGSRKEVTPISSQTIKHDDRKVILYFYENDKQTNLSQLEFDNGDYGSFMALIPDKEYHAVLSINSATSHIGGSPTNQILELAKLKDAGILTEEEFAEKKKELLAKI